MTHDAVSRNDKMNVSQRRAHNRDLALRLANAGVAVFPSSGKTPLIPCWTGLDTRMSREEIDAASARCEDQHGRAPAHVGATCDADVVKALWRAFPDAVPSISCGANNLLVLDADTKRDGRSRLIEWAAQAGVDLSQAPTTCTQSGGLHVFFRNDPESPLGNAAGAFHDMGVDVRGEGGQVVAPGAIREDGRTYTAKPGAPSLFDAARLDSFPPIPAPVRSMIARKPKAAQNVSAEDERAAIEKLATHDWPTFDELTDSIIGKFDLDSLREKDDELNSLLIVPGDDHSDNRFELAKCLHREYKSLAVLDFAAILEHFNDELDGAFGAFVGDARPDQGEYSLRSIARDYLRSRNCPTVASVRASEHFGVVEEIDDYLPPHVIEARERREAERESTKRPLIILDGDADDAWAPVDYFVEGVIPQKSVGIFFGPPGALKSFAAIDMASHIARGRAWQGLRTERAGVIYWHGEGQAGVAGRFRAWRRAYGGEGGAVGLADTDLNFLARDVERKIKKIIDAYETASGQTCGLFIVDTLSKATIGMDSNGDKEAAMALRHAELAARNLGVTILFVAHTGKDEQRGVRGSSAFEGNVDFRLKIEKSGKLTVERMKDGAKRAPLMLKTKAVEIGTNKHGEAVTSLVILPPAARCDVGAVEDHDDAADLGPAQASHERPPAQPDDGDKLSERQRRVLDLAKELDRPFTGRELHAAYNRAYGRKDGTVGEDAIGRTLGSLRGAYLEYVERPNRRDNRWTVLNQGEAIAGLKAE